MSRKWTNLFRKKSRKADSHGTTAADEELQFQPVPPQHKEPTRLSAMQSNSQALPMHKTGDRSTIVDDMQKERFSRQTKKGYKDNDRKVFANNKENYRENWNTDKLQKLNVDGETTTKEQITSKNLDREKILLKQGGLLEPPRDYIVGSQGKDVSISEEYSDPFDALKQRALERGKGTDGYIEPYKAQQMHFEIAAQGASGQGSNNEGAFDGNYHQPWDKRNESMDYEDPWDSNKQATLPYVAKKASDGSPHFDTERLQLHRKLHNDRPQNDSLSSVASSGSSASPSTAAHRLVRVEHPRKSPKSSPHFDRRLVLAKDHGYNNYSEPWGNQSKFRPIDKRLIKAEPSLEELRRMSPGGRSSPGTGSPLSSGRGSPDIPQSQLARTSPLTASRSRGGLPSHLISMNKSKSRSLDMRNSTVAFVAAHNLSGHILPKSASDDHLTSASSCHCIAPAASGQQLNRLCEYEEPWDKSTLEQSNAHNNVSHGRSRSYDMHESPLACGQVQSNTMKPGVTMHDDSFYEHPWDKNPADHLQSMQRFQQKRLELHPTEAINTRDFDPLRPLESQTWYHSAITRDEAEARLSGKLHGSFLVRKSESTKDSYSLSVQSSKGCIHMLLRCTRDDNWILGEFSAPFLSAPEMVAYYTRKRLKISDSDYVLLSYPVADTIM